MKPSRRLALAVAIATTIPLSVGIAVAATTVAPTLAAAATSGGIKVAYYDQWSIYQNAYFLKNVDTSGVASKLDFMLYDFENIDPVNLTCFETTKATDPDPGGENDPNAGDGAEDEFADIQKGYDAGNSVDGVADTFNQPLAGNFNQLKKLKARHPNLKVLLSLGGWTYSKYFSDAAATSASRQKFVSSCIDMFIKGNLPVHDGVHGGPGVAAGIFDGFDIDWEYPGSAGGHLGNHVSPNDTVNFTALLSEFRTQLNALGGAHKYVTAAVPAGQDKIAKIETNKIGQFLDFADVMTYDMHGAWDATGPTNHQDPVFNNPADPSNPIAPGSEKYNTDNAIKAWTTGSSAYGIPGGFPASKINIGFPFYYRGWTGVAAGSNHGLYMPASGPTAGHTLSGNVPGVAMYKELTGIVDNASTTFYDPVAQSAYFYNGTDFWTGDSPRSVQAKADYLHCKGLGGAMMFSLYDLDPGTTLFNAVVNDVNGSASSCTSPTGTGSPTPTSSRTGSPTASPTSSPTRTSSPTASPTRTSSPTTGPPPGNAVVNGGLETGNLSPWTCTGNLGSVVSSPVHGGSKALQGAASSSDNAQCSQTITVQPGHTYTLAGWVQGNYVFLGVTGTGATDTSTWTPGASSYSKLSVVFNTGASTTSVTVWVHGWYAQGTYFADDISVS